MAEIIACPSCQRQLQVPETFFGQTVQCPDCQHQFQAVAPTSAVQSAAPAAAKPASADGEEREKARPRKTYDDDDDNRDRRGKDEDDDDDLRFTRRRSRLQPHRGTLVLILGVLAICCVGAPVTGIVAWILGHLDLKEMDAGRMDPEGRGQTQTGKILGMISVILTVVGIGGYCLIVFFAMAAGALNAPRRRG